MTGDREQSEGTGKQRLEGAYLTEIAYPSTDGVAHEESFSWNLSTGELASSTDEKTRTGCTDGLGRMYHVTEGGFKTPWDWFH